MGGGHRKFEKWVEEKTGLDFIVVYLIALFGMVILVTAWGLYAGYAYVIIDKKKIVGMTKKAPALTKGQFAIRLHIKIDDVAFENRFPEVCLEVPVDAMIPPHPDVTVEVPE